MGLEKRIILIISIVTNIIQTAIDCVVTVELIKKSTMKRPIVISLLLLMSFNIMAQRVRPTVLSEEQKKQEVREKINLDYSVPDYNVKRPDAKVMGWRLAKILQSLEKNYTQPVYNQMLSQIRSVQMGDQKVRYSHIDKVKIHNIQKQDSVITIKINTFSKIDKRHINYDVVFTFVNSVSDDVIANYLFSDIGRYIRKNEE